MDYTERIRALHRELGIAPDYAAVRGLPLQPEATELVVAGTAEDGREIQLTPAATAAWDALCAAARRDGIELRLLSGFRSVDRQAKIIRRKLAAGQWIADILRVNTAPGYSEHHTGRAADFGTPGERPLEESFAGTAAFCWLETHAPAGGFRLSYPRDNPHGIAFEPWHWCWQNTSAP